MAWRNSSLVSSCHQSAFHSAHPSENHSCGGFKGVQTQEAGGNQQRQRDQGKRQETSGSLDFAALSLAHELGSIWGHLSYEVRVLFLRPLVPSQCSWEKLLHPPT